GPALRVHGACRPALHVAVQVLRLLGAVAAGVAHADVRDVRGVPALGNLLALGTGGAGKLARLALARALARRAVLHAGAVAAAKDGIGGTRSRRVVDLAVAVVVEA